MSADDGLTRECSYDPTYDLVEFPEPKKNHVEPIQENDENSSTNGVKSRRKPLLDEEFKQFFQDDGRIVDEHALRKLVFKGGINPDIRRGVWQFIFGLYPFTSTSREREVLKADYHFKYNALKERWKTELEASSPQLVGSGGDNAKSSSIDSHLQLSPETEQQAQFLKIQAQVHAGRQNIDLEELKSSIRIIDKDVHRTDRDLEYFKGEDNPNLRVLRNILITFAAFHPLVTYAQGMNDILSRFLIVFDSEVEAYWCFTNYMEQIQKEFTEEGMVRKVELVQKLLSELDKDLLDYLTHIEVGDLTFCHRWLILTFKREFNYEDSFRCFEILSSHHLELYSMEAEKARIGERRKEFAQQAGGIRTIDVEANTEFTFDIFMCVAIIIDHRGELFNCTDPTSVFQFIISLALKLDLDYILKKSEDLFYKYCRKSVTDCFEVIERPSNTTWHVNK